jgi:prephenate dehydrogenase
VSPLPAGVRLAIVGPGLIGGSAALAARAAGLFAEYTAWTPDAGEARTALRLGIADRMGEGLAQAVEGADFILVAVPPQAMAAVFSELRPALAAGAVVTDVGSVKGPVVAAARAGLGSRFADFVPGHPLAGAERHGAAAARADLFRAHRVILTPVDGTDAAATERVAGFWHAVGARVERLDPAVHDELLALTSHLPHLLAFALVDHLVDAIGEHDPFRYAAGGFRDFTRIAASDADLWADIACANRDALLAAVSGYRARLGRLEAALAAGDRAALASVFARARAARQRFQTQTSEATP